MKFKVGDDVVIKYPFHNRLQSKGLVWSETPKRWIVTRVLPDGGIEKIRFRKADGREVQGKDMRRSFARRKMVKWTAARQRRIDKEKQNGR